MEKCKLIQISPYKMCKDGGAVSGIPLSKQIFPSEIMSEYQILLKLFHLWEKKPGNSATRDQSSFITQHGRICNISALEVY